MEIIYNPLSLIYLGNDLESPSRLDGIRNIGREFVPTTSGEEFLSLVHGQRHIRKIKKSCDLGQEIVEVKTNPQTYLAACQAVATSVEAAKTGSFAAIRPPGHHSSKETSAGFCFFNNIAIATQYLLNEGKRVCLLDIDGHHGDGTERIFQRNGGVLFWSTYQSVDLCSLTLQDRTKIRRGEGKGRGLIHNIPLEEGAGDEVLMNQTAKFLPYIERFNPDVIGISAGFDGYKDDKLLKLKFTEQGYQNFGNLIGSLGVKTFGVLEGGYHNRVVSCIESLVIGINSSNH